MKKLLLGGILMSIFTVKAQAGFNVIGITTRTTNKVEMQGNGLIGKLWQRFFMEQVLAKIPNKIDQAVVGVYYDFESDKNGEYTLLVGARVASLDDIPEGLVGLEVPAGKMAVFTTEKGPLTEVTVGTWMRIWDLEDQGKLDRTYIADYEIYDERSADPANAMVEIHIGIR